ncbi:MAG: YkgJ family cysteine cluster protein [Labilithrix sp.]|nr:YkgJ family cysteine cluster protein [Labilithrix sp.]MBX3213652.1 YkgJ family cysteine cluster protein [Labilithrix sp.]
MVDRRPAVPSETIDWVEELHALVDEAVAPVERLAAGRLRCRAGCADCCVDDLTVFAIEAAAIRRHHAELLETAEPRPPGGCAFLDASGGCRIYAHRPYVCRTQGLPLRWLEEDELEEEIIESRDICPKNIDGGPPLEELDADACWTLGPFEQRLAEQQHRVDGDVGERVALRSLFARGDARRHLPLLTPERSPHAAPPSRGPRTS